MGLERLCTNVFIGLDKDHLSFINHNRPLPPITIEDLNTKVDFDDRQYLNDELKDMFFSLNLIQSYGSGIRRAKKAMEDNGSPKLVYSPDNDTDDYTQVVAYINEEFARIQEEESQSSRVNSPKIPQEKSVEDKIIEALIECPEITRNELAIKLDLKPEAIKYRLKILKEAGRIEHQGSTKAGKWVVLK